MTAVVIGATAPQAQAAGTDEATGGRIALYNGSGDIETVEADGSDVRETTGLLNSASLTPNWAPDGSRVVVGAPRQLTSEHIVGSLSRVTTPPLDPSFPGSWKDAAVYWLDGAYVVASTGSELFAGPSDGAFAMEPLLPPGMLPPTACDSSPTTSPDDAVVFVRTDPCGGSAGGDIWGYDPYADAVSKIITNGSSPSFSADGSKLAFIRVVNGRQQIFTAAADGSNVTQVTTDAVDHRNPSWDPAGDRIAYDQVDPASGASKAMVLHLSGGFTSVLSSAGSKPAWQPLRRNDLVRVYGTGAIGIDDAASRWTFDTVGAAHVNGLLPARSAVLVNKGNGTYAAPAVSLAPEKQGPVLMTSGTSLDASVVTELQRSLPKGSTVYLEGGTNLLSSGVESQVKALGYTPLRLGGTDLSAVSARVARQITTAPSWVFVADGMDFHDPVAAASAAGSLGYRGTGVVLLTRGTTVESSVLNYLNALNPATTNLVSVGTNARKALENAPLSKPWQFWDVSGSSTEATAVNLARFWWAGPDEATVQDTWSWQNAVTGNAVTATYGPVLWSTIDRLSAGTKDYLTSESASVWNVQTFGGNDAYSPANRTDIGNAIAASSAWTTTDWIAGGTPPTTAASAAPHAAGTSSSADNVHPTRTDRPVPSHPSHSSPTHHTAS